MGVGCGGSVACAAGLGAVSSVVDAGWGVGSSSEDEQAAKAIASADASATAKRRASLDAIISLPSESAWDELTAAAKGRGFRRLF